MVTVIKIIIINIVDLLIVLLYLFLRVCMFLGYLFLFKFNSDSHNF